MQTPHVNRCVFCDIVKKNVATRILFEDLFTMAFLDQRPLFSGHTLLITRDHFETLSDLPENIMCKLFINAQKIDRAIRKALNASGSFIAVNNKISQSVPHFHLHIVPRNHNDGLRGFFWPRTKYSSETAECSIFEKIRIELNSL